MHFNQHLTKKEIEKLESPLKVVLKKNTLMLKNKPLKTKKRKGRQRKRKRQLQKTQNCSSKHEIFWRPIRKPKSFHGTVREPSRHRWLKSTSFKR